MNKKFYVYLGIAIAIVTMFTIAWFIIQPKKEIKIGLLLKTLNNPFFVEIKDGAESYLNENNLSEKYKLLIQAGKDESDIQSQRESLGLMIESKCKAICITPTSPDGLNDLLAKATRKGIYVIVVDTKLNEKNLISQGGKINCYIGSNNFDGGQKAANYLINELHSKNVKAGKVLFFEGVPDQETAQERKNGFYDQMKIHPEFSIDHEIGNWSKETAFIRMKHHLATNQKYDAIFASNDSMILGAIEALKGNNIDLKSIITVGFDATAEALEAIKRKELNATIKQQPVKMGSDSIGLSMQLISNRPVIKDNAIAVEVVD
jgi:ribose transport system substrate-binding protein